MKRNLSSTQEGRPEQQGIAITTSAAAPGTRRQNGEAVQYPSEINLWRERGTCYLKIHLLAYLSSHSKRQILMSMNHRSVSLRTLHLPRSIFATTCCSTLALHQHGTFTPLTLASLSYFVTCLATFEKRPWLLAQAPSQSQNKSESARKEDAKFYKRAELAANEASFLIEVSEIVRQGTIRLLGVFCFDMPHIASHAHQDPAQPAGTKHPAIPSQTEDTMPKHLSRGMLPLPLALPIQQPQIKQPALAKNDTAKKIPRTMFPPPLPRSGARVASAQTSRPALAQGGRKQNEMQGDGQWSHKTWIDISILKRETHFLMKKDHAIWTCAEHGNVIEIGVVNLSPGTV
ncbi:hypothetical protein BP5796_09197 [Coleophoma crateriformis]|uniref:Uncharacterized protein n=1 Tax=Coleophoma crateriformis TaxID=565419 RepID=A0A3D8R3K6_9HELO|nr:hypothetical protein BP5796_09197 [Coleophoma crateriformis]